MSIEWKTPPRSEVDDWDEIAQQLHAYPGEWARVERGVGKVGIERYTDHLEDRDLEWRFIRTDGLAGTYGELGDLYARAPERKQR